MHFLLKSENGFSFLFFYEIKRDGIASFHGILVVNMRGHNGPPSSQREAEMSVI